MVLDSLIRPGTNTLHLSLMESQISSYVFIKASVSGELYTCFYFIFLSDGYVSCEICTYIGLRIIDFVKVAGLLNFFPVEL